MLKENQRPVWQGIFKFLSQDGEPVQLLGSKCKSCGKVFFPKRAICSNCFTDTTMADYELSTQGKIYSYTVVHYQGLLGIKSPYAYGFVDLPQDNVRVLSIFTECENLEINMDVELTIENLYKDSDDGKEIIGYKFRPLKKETIAPR
jgi:uncharacterized OB-fold protein